MDKFEIMYELQLELQEYLYKKKPEVGCLPNLSEQERDTKFKSTTLDLITECVEALKETNFKCHVPDSEVSRDALREELIDQLKFWFNLCILYDFKPYDLYVCFCEKDEKVREKFEKNWGK